jgi:hypothetical protein
MPSASPFVVAIVDALAAATTDFTIDAPENAGNYCTSGFDAVLPQRAVPLERL